MIGEPGPVVVKVGGSLLAWPELAERLGAFLARRSGDRLVVIAGGGGAADWVRALDRAHGLGEVRAHALALRSLDLTAWVLASVVAGLDVVETVGDLGPIWAMGRTPILAPRRFLDEEDRVSADPLPHCWDVTSDSITARVAVRIGARELILLKSVSGPEGEDLAEWARLGLVDPWFPTVARGVLVRFVNLRQEFVP